jgi:hypothetical protein
VVHVNATEEGLTKEEILDLLASEDPTGILRTITFTETGTFSSVEPQRMQRSPSRSLAARLNRCHAKRSSSGREEPERCGRAQRTQRPREPGGRTTAQLGQRRVSSMSDRARESSLVLPTSHGFSEPIGIRKAYA